MIPDWRYPTVMSNLIYTGMTAAQASESIARMLSSGTVDQVRWKELSKQPDLDLKIKGDKRNGTMSRQQAFGGLFK
ncbi:hypothetical protein [Candidatus Enterococcus ikei]|uniref:Uncharacterized protein n=1 Tax=Candidatus Enterococcus ikei TaxID=2815326 RepID=A0ABS3GUL6_9ENTE|nr:hypothetical protein [Enterococcus sp. DIV0869a]MBO0438946.1 hypothetical protein [Enterococcus sp. DIV0869a]